MRCVNIELLDGGAFSATSVFYWLDCMACDQESIEAVETALNEAAADGIRSVTVDGMSVSLEDMSKRERRLEKLQNKCAARKSNFGLRFTRLISPGGGG